jgi:hypothetical protein
MFRDLFGKKREGWAFGQGKIAYANEVPISDNPYSDADLKDYQDWAKGWEKACEERKSLENSYKPFKRDEKTNATGTAAYSLENALVNGTANESNKAIEIIEGLSEKGNPSGVQILEQVIKHIGGNPNAKFFYPGTTVLSFGETADDYIVKICRIAADGKLLYDPYESGQLIMRFKHLCHLDEADRLLSEVRKYGTDAERAVVLIDNLTRCYALLARARGLV